MEGDVATTPSDGFDRTPLTKAGGVMKRRKNPGDLLPDGREKQLAMKDPEIVAEFRKRAAEIAVDMERGIYIRHEGAWAGKQWEGPYSKRQIAEDLGFNARANNHLPKFFDEPEWSRTVEYERIKRDANYRLAIKESIPMIDAVVNGFLQEAARRILMEPEKVPSHVLFPELRKMLEMKAEYEGAFRFRPDVNVLVLKFQEDIKTMPDAARQRALDMFMQELRALTSGVKGMHDGVIEGEFQAAIA